MSNIPTDVGVLLKQERERKSLSLEVVHEATKIPLDALKAIEEGYKVRTLSSFYYKSFVKIYALYLGMDAGPVVAMIPTHHPKEQPSASPVRPGLTRALPSSGAGAYKVEGVRSWNLLSHPIILKKKKKVFKAVVITACVVLGVVVLGFIGKKIVAAVSVNQAMDKADRAQEKRSSAKAPALKTQQAKAPAAASVETKAKEKMVKTLKRASVTVKAQTTTWISVRIDGVGVFQGRLKKGSSETWQGEKKIELSAKDTGALEFEVNGRNIGKLSRRDLKAKKVIVTPEGLSVE